MPFLGTALKADPLFPGGTVTLSSSGTFNLPPGISKITVQAKGAPGNSGNPGN